MTIFTIGQSFVKSIGVFPGVRGTSLKIRLGLKELKNLHVIVTDQYPEVGKMAEGMVDQFRGHPSFYYVRSKGRVGGR